jgi:hypothetical protein
VLHEIQQSFPSEMLELLDEFEKMLADIPADDLDREISNIGHVLMLTLKNTAPHLSEAMQYSLPFAFVEMLRERVLPQESS